MTQPAKTKKPNKEDLELYKRFQKEPLFFIEKVWGLKPQPLKPEYAEDIEYIELEEFKVEWFEPFIKGKHITWQQYLLFMAVQRAITGKSKKRIAIESGMGTGKSSGIAMLILWFLFTHKDAQVPCTAPTSAQMHDVLWKEISLWLSRMPKPIQSLYEWSSEYIRIAERPNTWFARARTASKDRPEALAGVHSDFVLALADEASGVPEEVFRIGEGVLTGDKVYVILISQHTRLTGYFHDAFNSDKKNWQNLRFNAEQSPIVDNQFVERIVEKYGKDSDEYRVQVLGESPKADAVDNKGYVPLFMETDVRYCEDMGFIGTKWLGVDPAGGGNDEAMWVVRDEFHSEVVAREKISDENSLLRTTLAVMQMLQIYPQNVFVDDFGVGSKLVANLAKQSVLIGSTRYPCYVKGVNTGDLCEDEEDKERFANMRAYLAWKIKEWVKKGGMIKKDKTNNEMFSIRYKANMRNRIQIMSKDDMRKEGYASPNFFDALALTFSAKTVFKPNSSSSYQDNDWAKDDAF